MRSNLPGEAPETLPEEVVNTVRDIFVLCATASSLELPDEEKIAFYGLMGAIYLV